MQMSLFSAQATHMTCAEKQSKLSVPKLVRDLMIIGNSMMKGSFAGHTSHTDVSYLTAFLKNH